MTGSPPRLWDLTGAEIELDGGPISACAINVNDADVDVHSRHRSASTTRSPATSALNNCFNAIAMHARDLLDYLVPSSFGNLELRPRADTEFIGQPIDYSAGKTVAIQKISIDAMALPRRPHQTRRAGHGARGTRRRAADDRALPPDLPSRIAQGRPRAAAYFPRRARLQGARGRLQPTRRAQERPVVQQLQLPDMPAQSAA